MNIFYKSKTYFVAISYIGFPRTTASGDKHVVIYMVLSGFVQGVIIVADSVCDWRTVYAVETL